MDEHDLFASRPPVTQEKDVFGFKNIDETSNFVSHDQKEDSSWVIENKPETTTRFQSDAQNTNALDSWTPPTAAIQSDISGGGSSSSATFQSDALNANNFDNWTAPTSAFQSDIPVGDTLDNVSSSATFNEDIFGNQSITLPPTAEDIFSDNSTNKQPENVSNYNLFSNESVYPLQAFNEKRQQEIAEKDAEEKKKIEELRQQAKHDLERWYNERQRQMEQKRQTMKQEDDDLSTKALEKSTKESCDWAKVIRFLDFSQGSQLTRSKQDISRMRTCIIDSKRINDAKTFANGV